MGLQVLACGLFYFTNFRLLSYELEQILLVKEHFTNNNHESDHIDKVNCCFASQTKLFHQDLTHQDTLWIILSLSRWSRGIYLIPLVTFTHF